MAKYIATQMHSTLFLGNNVDRLVFAVHAGRMAIFKHPMNFKESCLQPCLGDGAYTEEEQAWWNGTLSYLVASLDVDGRQSRGVPERAVPRMIPHPRAAAAASGARRRRRRQSRRKSSSKKFFESSKISSNSSVRKIACTCSLSIPFPCFTLQLEDQL